MRGEYQHTIDAKGRFIFPIKLREEIGDTFVITRGLDGCLWIFSNEGWVEFEAKISAVPAKARKMQRFFSANFLCEPDGQGRILVPPVLRKHASLEKDITVVVVQNRIEVWDTAQWDAYNSATSDDDIADIMEEMGI